MNPRPVRAALLALVLVGCGAGCRTVDPSPLDLSTPGWTVQETDAVWVPGADAPEVPGEVLVAVHVDGRRFVQFSRQGLPLVQARQVDGRWSLRSPLRPGVHGGPGRGTRRVPWFVVDRLPPTPGERRGWVVEALPDGRWRVRQRRAGQMLEGLDP